VRTITAFDRVELPSRSMTRRPAPVGGVLDLRDGDTAIIEITTPELDTAARIIFLPLAKLRRVA
jgi:hypothetical protein